MMMAGRAAISLAIMQALTTSCTTTRMGYDSYDDVPYPFEAERSIWSARAGLSIRLAVLNATATATAAPPIVLLHPWGLNMTVWNEVAPALAQDRAVLLVDLPAHGKSDKAHTAYPMKRLAAAIVDAMDAVGFDRAYVAGNSLGGSTSIEVARNAPDRVKALILVAAPGGRALPVALRRLARTVATPEALASLSDEAWWVGLNIVQRSDRPLAQRLRRDLMALREAAEFPAWCRASLTVLRSVVSYMPPLEALDVPALVVHGDGDFIVSPSLNESLARRLKGARLAVLKDCGHLPEIECPARLLAEMQSFLQAQDQVGPVFGASTWSPDRVVRSHR